MTTSKKFSRLAHVAGMLAAGAIVLATANVASAGNIGELPAKPAPGSVHDYHPILSPVQKPSPGFVNTIHPILSPGQKPLPGFVNTIHPIIVGKGHDHDHYHDHGHDHDRYRHHGDRDHDRDHDRDDRHAGHKHGDRYAAGNKPAPQPMPPQPLPPQALQ